MAKKNPHVDRAQAKAAKQKKIVIGLSVFLVLVLAYEVPKTMKMMHPKAKAPVVATDASAPPAASPTTGATTPPAGATAAPAAVPSLSSASLVASVPVSPAAGQLTEFSEFASKDPFDQTVQKTTASGAGSTTSTAKPTGSKPPATPKTPPAPPPSAAVISVNGTLMSVAVGTQFPTTGTPLFAQIGSPLFQLDSLTSKTAKVSIVGGSYASGAPSLTLTAGTPVTLQNTADGTRYTLELEPQGTQVPTAPTSTDGLTSTTPTSTTPAPATSVVPSGTGG